MFHRIFDCKKVNTKLNKSNENLFKNISKEKLEMNNQSNNSTIYESIQRNEDSPKIIKRYPELKKILD